MLAPFRGLYGSHPLHLLTMAVGFALAGYLLVTVKPATLLNPQSWWQSIALWFAVAIVAHDLVLFPLYSLADRILAMPDGRQTRRQRPPRVPARNYLRIPALGTGLTLLVFFPGIVQQGAATYLAATGQTQQPFLARWLLLTAAMFAASAAAYLIRLVMAHRQSSAPNPTGERPRRNDDRRSS